MGTPAIMILHSLLVHSHRLQLQHAAARRTGSPMQQMWEGTSKPYSPAETHSHQMNKNQQKPTKNLPVLEDFADGTGVWHLKSGGVGTLELRGTRFVGTKDSPMWQFPNGVRRSWNRPKVISPEELQWMELFLKYKAEPWLQDLPELLVVNGIKVALIILLVHMK